MRRRAEDDEREYTLAVLVELARLSRRRKHRFLSYLLDMAASEARRPGQPEECQPAPANVATIAALLRNLPDERV